MIRVCSANNAATAGTNMPRRATWTGPLVAPVARVVTISELDTSWTPRVAGRRSAAGRLGSLCCASINHPISGDSPALSTAALRCSHMFLRCRARHFRTWAWQTPRSTSRVKSSGYVFQGVRRSWHSVGGPGAPLFCRRNDTARPSRGHALNEPFVQGCRQGGSKLGCAGARTG